MIQLVMLSDGRLSNRLRGRHEVGINLGARVGKAGGWAEGGGRVDI
jgi:hypothetical protein